MDHWIRSSWSTGGVADIRKVLGEMKEAEAAYREAVAIRATVSAERPAERGTGTTSLG